jgi:hypothetical protein
MRPKIKRLLRKANRPARRGRKRVVRVARQSIRRSNKVRQPPTIAQVELAMRDTLPKTYGTGNNAYAMYAKCRLDPFNTLGSVGVPDASSARRVVVDHRVFADFTIGTSGTCVLKTFAAFPCPLFFKVGSNTGSLTVNGTNFVQGATGTNYNLDWIPAMVFSEYSSQSVSGFGAATTVLDPFVSARYRVVTQAFRIFYTGQANTCAGMITVQSDPITMEASPSVNPYLLTQFTYTGGSQSTQSLLSGLYYAVKISSGSSPYALYPNTVQSRPETGANILVKHTAPAYDWVPMREYLITPMSGEQPTYAYTALVSSFSNGAFQGIDPAWESVTITMNGFTPGTSFRVECVMCVEYEPMPASSVARFAKETAISSPAAVAVVDAVAKTIPVSVPLSMNMAPWVRQAIRTISSLGPAIGSAFGPIGAGIGGVVSAAGAAF